MTEKITNALEPMTEAIGKAKVSQMTFDAMDDMLTDADAHRMLAEVFCANCFKDNWTPEMMKFAFKLGAMPDLKKRVKLCFKAQFHLFHHATTATHEQEQQSDTQTTH